MALEPLWWCGYFYQLEIRRHWRVGFALGVLFKIEALREEEILLPEVAGRHIMQVHKLVERARDYFDTPDHWFHFYRRLCDQYCDFYGMNRPLEGNTFREHINQDLLEAVQNFAKLSEGYVGPDKWVWRS